MDFLLSGCANAFLSNKNIYISLFLGAAFGSLHHCAGMCGPFIIAQTSNKQNSQNILVRATGNSLLPYHMGRMVTYIFLGVAASFVMVPILNSFIGRIIIALLLGGAGILFLLHGLSQHIHLKLPFTKILTNLSRAFSFEASVWHKFALGITLGFMPCGLVFAAVLAVSSLGNPLEAMLGMMIFTCGTLPILLSIGLVSNTLMKKYRPLYIKFTKTMMIFNGLVLISLSVEKII